MIVPPIIILNYTLQLYKLKIEYSSTPATDALYLDKSFTSCENKRKIKGKDIL